MSELRETVLREREPPYFGWLSTELPCYENDTFLLKTNVHTRPVGGRPFVEMEPTDHPLAVEQRNGITSKRIQEVAECVRHKRNLCFVIQSIYPARCRYHFPKWTA